LAFAAATIPGSPAVSFHVSSTDAGGAPADFSGTVPQSGAQDPYLWKRFESKPLPASTCRKFRFAAGDAKSQKGIWLTIAGAAIR
jgi:hypothetical protein